MQTRNSPYNKIYNRQLIIRNLFKKKISRAELSRITGLTRAAITVIVDELIQDGLVKESEIDVRNDVVGRNPSLLEIVPARYHTVGVDIARDGCSIGLVDFGGNVLISQTVNLENAITPELAVEVICKQIKHSLITEDEDYSRILGIGITTPGPVDTINGIIDDIPDFQLWRGFHIVEEFKKHFQLNIHLERDANAVALAELYFGYGKRFDSFISISSYIGLGFGVIKNRRIYAGILGLTPEFGHVSINFDGPKCVCGNNGCLYLYYGYSNIMNRVQADFPSISSWREIVDRALEGEKYFLNIIDHYAHILSIAIVNAINLFALNKIVLSGFVIYKPEIFLNSLYKYVRGTYITKNFFDVEIVVTEMQKDENLIAAATGVIENSFNMRE